MGTMGGFFDGDPAKGGHLIGWVGMDGHPDQMKSLAEATNRKSFLLRARAHGRRRKSTWVPPRPGCWAYWPGLGYMVLEFSYWFDEERQRPMVGAFKAEPKEFTLEVAENSELWPDRWGPIHDPFRKVFLPEVHVTADPDAGVPLHRWTTANDRDGEVDVTRVLSGDAEVSIIRRGKTRGIWCSGGDTGMFELRDSYGKPLGSGRHLVTVCTEASNRMRGNLGAANPDWMKHYKLYSVEAFFEEMPIGDAEVRRERGVFHVRHTHPVLGTHSSSSDRLHEALLTTRRTMLAHPDFVLDGITLAEELALERMGNS